LVRFKQNTIKGERSTLWTSDKYLEDLKTELKDHISEYQRIENRAIRSAKSKIYLGFLVATS
jgi:hypothetical protein